MSMDLKNTVIAIVIATMRNELENVTHTNIDLLNLLCSYNIMNQISFIYFHCVLLSE